MRLLLSEVGVFGGGKERFGLNGRRGRHLSNVKGKGVQERQASRRVHGPPAIGSSESPKNDLTSCARRNLN